VSFVLNRYNFVAVTATFDPSPALRRRNSKQNYKLGSNEVDGTVVAKKKTRTRRVDKGKSGQALKTAVSGGFGGGILSQIDKTSGDSFGGTEPRLLRS
jgi:hypothetical protein